VTVIGASYTGKTALVRRFVGCAAPKGYSPTIESLFRTNYCANGVKYVIVWSEKYRSLITRGRDELLL
jgi:GTPase SAR1 family protein